MRTEPRELKINTAKRRRPAPAPKEADRKLQVNVFTSETVDEAFASFNEAPPATIETAGAVTTGSPAEVLRENQAIVSEIARQLEALDQQRKKLASLLHEMQD